MHSHAQICGEVDRLIGLYAARIVRAEKKISEAHSMDVGYFEGERAAWRRALADMRRLRRTLESR